MLRASFPRARWLNRLWSQEVRKFGLSTAVDSYPNPGKPPPKVHNLIRGKFVESQSDVLINVVNPATQEVVSRVPLTTPEEFKDAVSAAKQAFPSWRNTPITARQRVMLKLQELIRRDIEKLALNITTEQGKTLRDAHGDVFRGLEVVEHVCGMASLQMGEFVSNVSNGISGGIVLDIQEGNTIIMYRGKNYSQPPPEIMSPRVTLSRKALDKSKFRDALRAVQNFIPRLECQLETVQASMSSRGSEEKVDDAENALEVAPVASQFRGSEFSEPETSENVYDPSRRGPVTEVLDISEPESLSDIFETDSEDEKVDKGDGGTLYLDAIDAMTAEDDNNSSDDFEEYLRQFSKERWIMFLIHLRSLNWMTLTACS